ncbi:ABC transporter substrate-binding protein [Actinocorallia sp. API 0066]|uniref:ABC transporter substrate-binding protein n=1 Tax=Actinocorallia sp. API 0066 TaxID=2896846 RepID=UPI001E322079|nr:ABC transporter substrate-binding protein [Actinocorallia sp. API 0066]MCD0449481.1 ABC transporter substrate-binding protein [Actinocorallia sp. API 0066]
MRHSARLTALAATVLLAVSACGGDGDEKAAPGGTSEVTVALSWSPNTDYTGLYVADKLGYLRDAGISLKIIPFASTAPETLVEQGTADFGFSYQAGVAYARAAGHDVVAAFAPNQKGTYAIAVRADRDDIASPKDLDGKTYAGFGTPDEVPELRHIIKHDGGKGEFKNVSLSTAAYDAVYNGRADFTISVKTWEVVQAELVGKPVKTFELTDYGFPDQYSNLLATSRKYLDANGDEARAFLTAVQKGYAYAADKPKEAADILVEAEKAAFPDPQLVIKSQQALTDGNYLRDAKGNIGYQSPAFWDAYGNFLYDNGLLVDADGKKLTAKPDWSTYYTNEFLPKAVQ